MVTLTINGKQIKAPAGEMLLETIRRQDIEIPALCHHAAVEPFGACRLCTVEITRQSWDGWKNYVTSCLFPVEEGLIVQTHSSEVTRIRCTILDLLLASSPNSRVIQDLASEYGILASSYVVDAAGDDCILCGLCTRVCSELGMNAIATVERGRLKKVDTPFSEPSASCIGCTICAQVCPTGHIRFEERGLKRKIWYKEFKLIACSECGRSLKLTPEMKQYFSERQQLPEDYLEQCADCKQKQTVDRFNRIIDRSEEVI
ncbi:MAG: (2Fe-2S)-binding protein [Candidatus Delongbacteria bacterium]|nr:(2Fe-2S)-binding protein [Candidatus Delongbacteria bacterium]